MDNRDTPYFWSHVLLCEVIVAANCFPVCPHIQPVSKCIHSPSSLTFCPSVTGVFLAAYMFGKNGLFLVFKGDTHYWSDFNGIFLITFE